MIWRRSNPLDRLEGKFDGLEGKFDGLERKFDGLTENLPKIVAKVTREVLDERERGPEAHVRRRPDDGRQQLLSA